MIKADLVTAMAKASGGSKVSAERALNALLDGVFESLKRGRKVTIGGFGTFLVSRRAERNGRNPRTGKVIKKRSTRLAGCLFSREDSSGLLDPLGRPFGGIVKAA